MPRSTYDTFMYTMSKEIAKKMKEKLQKGSANILMLHTHASGELDLQLISNRF